MLILIKIKQHFLQKTHTKSFLLLKTWWCAYIQFWIKLQLVCIILSIKLFIVCCLLTHCLVLWECLFPMDTKVICENSSKLICCNNVCQAYGISVKFPFCGASWIDPNSRGIYTKMAIKGKVTTCSVSFVLSFHTPCGVSLVVCSAHLRLQMLKVFGVTGKRTQLSSLGGLCSTNCTT